VWDTTFWCQVWGVLASYSDSVTTLVSDMAVNRDNCGKADCIDNEGDEKKSRGKIGKKETNLFLSSLSELSNSIGNLDSSLSERVDHGMCRLSVKATRRSYRRNSVCFKLIK
jgi:hypothetical protein